MVPSISVGLADADGRAIGCHICYDCIVRTTAAVLVVPLPKWSFAREPDGKSGKTALS